MGLATQDLALDDFYIEFHFLWRDNQKLLTYLNSRSLCVKH